MLHRLSFLFLALFCVACGDDLPTFAAGSGRTCYSLIEEFDAAERWVEVDSLDLTELNEPNPLLKGWTKHTEPILDEEGKPKERRLWAVDRQVELALYFREIGARALELSIISAPGGEDNSARLKLNGHDIGGFEFGRKYQKHVLEMPPEVQVQGRNVLSVDMAKGVRLVETDPNSNDARLLTGCFRELRVLHRDKRVAKNAIAAKKDWPEGISLELDGRAIGQPSYSSYRWHCRVPKGARFASEVHAYQRAPSASDQSRFRLTLLRDGSDPVTLAETTLKVGETDRFEASLAEYEGEVVALELSLEDAGTPGGAQYGLWGQPEVQAPAQDPRPADPVALVDARQGLDGAPVVVTLLDAFNPSFMSCYGGRENLTPVLDGLAQEGSLFTSAYSPASYTIASIGTNLSGLESWQHGAWTQGNRMLGDAETWALKFQEAGYRTAAIVCSPNGSSLFGFDKGFEDFREYYIDTSVKEFIPFAHDVVPMVEQILAESETDSRPLFLWLHILQPHEPYDPPKPWKGMFDPDYEGELEPTTQTLRKVIQRKLDLTERELEHFKRAYESGIAYVDDAVGDLVEVLDAAPAFKGGLLSVYSDHGEQFMTHEGPILRYLGHGGSVHNDVLQIPMIVRLPEGFGDRGVRIDSVVGGQDLIATMADLVGVSAPLGSRTVSFAPLLFGATEGPRDVLIGHSSPNESTRFDPYFALYEDGYKLMTGQNLGTTLYDLREGKTETVDLATELPVRTAFMRQLLKSELGADPEVQVVRPVGDATMMDAGVLEQLRRLGY